jgi:ribonuclease HI
LKHHAKDHSAVKQLTTIRGGKCRGIIFFHEGHLETTFALRNSTNNQAEAYALLQGLLSVNEARVKTLIAINGSSMIINLMTSKKTPTDSKLAFLIAWIQKEVCKFQKVSFF